MLNNLYDVIINGEEFGFWVVAPSAQFAREAAHTVFPLLVLPGFIVKDCTSEMLQAPGKESLRMILSSNFIGAVYFNDRDYIWTVGTDVNDAHYDPKKERVPASNLSYKPAKISMKQLASM